MKLTSATVAHEATSTGFEPEPIEKVLRLVGLLDEHRSSGSLARHVATMRSSDADRAGFNRDTGGGSSFTIELITLARVWPSNAFRPVSISNSTQPKAKTSERASAPVPAVCSGAM